jgi:hypothetical protein
MGEENKPRINDLGDNNADARQGKRYDNRRNRHQWNQGQQQGGKFKGKTKEIEHDTFDNTGQHDPAQFNKSLKNIADYLQLNHGNDVSEAVHNLTPVDIPIPRQPVGAINPNDDTKRLPVTEVDLYLWKREHTKAQDRRDKYDENMAKAYIIVFHQCSPSLKNNLEASDTFATIHSAQDVMGLLKLVQSLCCLYNAKTQGVMATVASYKKLFTYYQKDGVDNHTFHRELGAHVETLETYGGVGVVGVVPTFLNAKIKELVANGLIANPANPTDAERALAMSSVQDEFLAALMLSGANRKRFGALGTDLKNQYGYGDDCYPKTIDNCLLLNRWQPFKELQAKTPRTPRTPATPADKDKVDDEALVFAQDSKKPAANQDDDSSSRKGSSVRSPPKTPKYRNVRCGACGELGHTSLVCPNKKPPVQVHVMSAVSLMTPLYAVTLLVSLLLLRTTAVAPPSTRTSSSLIARAQLIFSPTLLMLTMFAQLHIPSKFTATRVLCWPTMSLTLVPTMYMSTKITLPTYSPSSCSPKNIISPMIAMIAGGCSRFTRPRA